METAGMLQWVDVVYKASEIKNYLNKLKKITVQENEQNTSWYFGEKGVLNKAK